MEQQYDSTYDTKKHIARVNELLCQAADILKERGRVHDASKLIEPEKSYFDKFTPLLSSTTYGEEDYKNLTKQMKPATEHHYKHNSHHPQYYENQLDGMDLFDILEMFFDWKASGERTNNGNIYKSIKINENRFNISPQLASIFSNTANNLNYGFKFLNVDIINPDSCDVEVTYLYLDQEYKKKLTIMTYDSWSICSINHILKDFFKTYLDNGKWSDDSYDLFYLGIGEDSHVVKDYNDKRVLMQLIHDTHFKNKELC